MNCRNVPLRPALFQQPEEPLHRHVHHKVFCFLAGSTVDHVRDALHGLAHHGSFADASSYDLYARMRLQLPIVTQCADDCALVSRLVQNPANEIAAHLACRACHQDTAHLHPSVQESNPPVCLRSSKGIETHCASLPQASTSIKAAPLGWVSRNHVRDPHPLHTPSRK